MEKLSKTLDKLNVKRTDDTCWTCGKPGHRSPQCPDRGDCKPAAKPKSDGRGAGKSDRRPPPINKSTWQTVKPGAGEPETLVREGRTFYWCDTCAHWRTTHATSGHTGGKPKASPPNKEQVSANVAALTKLSDELSKLNLGAWFGRGANADTSELSTELLCLPLGVYGKDISSTLKRELEEDATSEYSFIFSEFPETDLENVDSSYVSPAKRQARHTNICTTCESAFFSPPSWSNAMCAWCLNVNLDSIGDQQEDLIIGP
jgi:hypothetical protein